MSRFLAGAVVGLACWFVMMVPAAILTGPGGGPPTWPAPFVVSLPGLLLLPITAMVFSMHHAAGARGRIRKVWTARVVLWFLLGLDAVLVADMGNLLSDLRQYGLWFLGPVLILGVPWLALWAFWHYVLVRTATSGPIRSANRVLDTLATDNN
jgi:hypothetical protein